jgi:hypothetical protein
MAAYLHKQFGEFHSPLKRQYVFINLFLAANGRTNIAGLLAGTNWGAAAGKF